MNHFDLDPKAPRHNFTGSSYDTYTLNWKAGNTILLEAGYSPTLIILHSKSG